MVWVRGIDDLKHGICGLFCNKSLCSLEVRLLEGPLEGGSALRKGPQHVLETLGVPKDPRGIVLLCGYVAAAAVGLIALLTPPSDLIGWAYIALAAMGYLFIQTRGLTTFLWLLVAGGGAAIGLAGGQSGWVEFALGLALVVVALVPVPPAYRTSVTPPQGPPRARLAGAVNGHSSTPEEFGSLALESSDGVTAPTSPPDHFTAGPSGIVNGNSSTPEESATVALESSDGVPAPAPGRLQIRAIGRLRLISAMNDLAPSLEGRSVLAFLFKYLLARYVLGQPPPGRDAFAEELSPGYPKRDQRKRLRQSLHDVQRDLAPAIAALVHKSRTHVWLELEQTDFDVAELREVANRIRQRGSMIDAELAAEVQALLDQTEGQEFLPGFEDLENKVNSGNGDAGRLVDQARELIANQRAELVRALAEYQEAIGHPEATIGHLQATLEALPARQDLARLLVVAYLRTGQTARASEIRRQYPLTQE